MPRQVSNSNATMHVSENCDSERKTDGSEKNHSARADDTSMTIDNNDMMPPQVSNSNATTHVSGNEWKVMIVNLAEQIQTQRPYQ